MPLQVIADYGPGDKSAGALRGVQALPLLLCPHSYVRVTKGPGEVIRRVHHPNTLRRQGLPQRVVYRASGNVAHVGQVMAVDVEGKTYVGVPQKPLNELGGLRPASCAFPPTRVTSVARDLRSVIGGRSQEVPDFR